MCCLGWLDFVLFISVASNTIPDRITLQDAVSDHTTLVITNVSVRDSHVFSVMRTTQLAQACVLGIMMVGFQWVHSCIETNTVPFADSSLIVQGLPSKLSTRDMAYGIVKIACERNAGRPFH